jgi:ABC-type Zn2+ transport system substrate-binding protein/surface adhesin
MALTKSDVEKFLQREKYKYEDTRRPGEKEGGSNDHVWIDKTRSYEVAQAIATTINEKLGEKELATFPQYALKNLVHMLENLLHRIVTKDGRLTREQWNKSIDDFGDFAASELCD